MVPIWTFGHGSSKLIFQIVAPVDPVRVGEKSPTLTKLTVASPTSSANHVVPSVPQLEVESSEAQTAYPDSSATTV